MVVKGANFLEAGMVDPFTQAVKSAVGDAAQVPANEVDVVLAGHGKVNIVVTPPASLGCPAVRQSILDNLRSGAMKSTLISSVSAIAGITNNGANVTVNDVT